MTSSAASGATRADARAQIAELLAFHFTENDDDRGCALRCGYAGGDRIEHLAERLLPIVTRALATQRAEIVARYEQVAAELGRFSDDAQFDWDRTGDTQQLGQRDAFDVAVSRIQEAAPK